MGARAELPEPDVARFSGEQLRFSRAAWPLHAAEELRSALILRALARAARAAAPLARAALGAILHDEVRHQRLGWTALGAAWPALSTEQRAVLQREAAAGLAACERQTAVPALRWLEAGRAFDPAYAALGVLHPELRVETFYKAVERLVVPRLTRLGLDGERAWSERYR